MRRFADADTLSARLASVRPGAAELRFLGERLRRFHADPPLAGAERVGDLPLRQRLRLRAPVETFDLRGDGVRLSTASGQRLDGWRPYAGPAIKYFSVVDRPFWLEEGLGPDALSDTPVGETWHATDGQRRRPRDPACLTVFSGGPAQRRPGGQAPRPASEPALNRSELIRSGLNRSGLG
ncbi:hypothetical protein [Synechococcus sp. CS-1328]|uniref:hypothetical protein n=1 Tax=Synechococcus sp. CS-1328 TaxID=2847976 RepID=UPI00223B9EA3|nr:hypothetical protein [Synechococcus sp. CS-1328]MCT0226216.1 hypothetical protein [Synechococcus sp. CS-1328]